MAKLPHFGKIGLPRMPASGVVVRGGRDRTPLGPTSRTQRSTCVPSVAILFKKGTAVAVKLAGSAAEQMPSIL